MTWTPIKKCPAKTDKRFIRKAKGGYNPAIAGKPLYGPGSVLSNCVGFVLGCVMIALDTIKCPLPSMNASLFWTHKDKFKRGQVPKPGAIACWKRKPGLTGANGHVAMVNEVYADGSYETANSAYNGTAFYLKKIPKNNFYSKRYNFQGFVYILDDEPEKVLPKGTRVEIIGTGNSRRDGKGRTAHGIGYTRIIKNEADLNYPFPYQVGTEKGTTGWYAPEALKVLDD